MDPVFKKWKLIFTRLCFCCSCVVLLLSLITNSSHLPFKTAKMIVRSKNNTILWIFFHDCACYVFLFRCQDICYDHMTSQSLQISSLFIHSCNFNWSACVTSFFTLSWASFLFIRVIKFLVVRDLPHYQKLLPDSEIVFFRLIQRDKIK